ncbi:hypothetical protein FISHEDRAFT_60787 [Fistulina hepatica ATCC 64428]|uniref:DUF6534 domain-containing protein n=1 Tax=Fistulina hepatica ATCC 64428 TaxID=1128425 RepID=A0A0D7A5G1_9AGAR|nr:hypothetical protein FISHEDRAFT_60787 [Fistulina hepatica ATCC 64428]
MSSTESSAAVASEIALFLGVLEVGILLNAFLFGIVLMQFVNYVSIGFEDTLSTKILVWYTFLNNGIHTMIACSLIWTFTITDFGDLTELYSSAPWQIAVSPLFIAAGTIPVQLFLALRVVKLAKRVGPYFLGLTCALMASHGSLALYLTIKMLADNTPIAEYQEYYKQDLQAWTALSSVTDVLITVALCVVLLFRRTGFKCESAIQCKGGPSQPKVATDSVLWYIGRKSVECAVPVVLFAIGHLVAFTVSPTTGFYLFFGVSLARLEGVTVFGTLNARAHLRGTDLSGSHPSNGGVKVYSGGRGPSGNRDGSDNDNVFGTRKADRSNYNGATFQQVHVSVMREEYANDSDIPLDTISMKKSVLPV